MPITKWSCEDLLLSPPWGSQGDTGRTEHRSPTRQAAGALGAVTAAPRGDFKTPVLSQAAHSLTSFPAECCCNHSALARLLLPSYKWFILTSGPFLLKSTSRYRAGDFSWQQRTPILGQRKQLCAALPAIGASRTAVTQPRSAPRRPGSAGRRSRTCRLTPSPTRNLQHPCPCCFSPSHRSGHAGNLGRVGIRTSFYWETKGKRTHYTWS